KAGPRCRAGYWPQSLSAAGACRWRDGVDRQHQTCAHGGSIRKQSEGGVAGRALPRRAIALCSCSERMNASRSDKAHDAARETVTLEFKRNAHLAALAGSHSRHLVRLEHKLGVKIAMRGNLIAIEGEPSARERAASVLRSLYERAEQGNE